MKEPDWAIALSYFYKKQEEVSYLHSLSESHELVESTDLSSHELEELMNDMHEMGLLDLDFPPTTVHTDDGRWETESTKFSLSKKGFDVAHERELSKSRHKINEKSTRLSAYLVIGIVLQSLVAILQYDENWQTAAVSAIILLLIFLVLSEIYRESIKERLNKHGVLDRIPEL